MVLIEGSFATALKGASAGAERSDRASNYHYDGDRLVSDEDMTGTVREYLLRQGRRRKTHDLLVRHGLQINVNRLGRIRVGERSGWEALAGFHRALDQADATRIPLRHPA